MKKTINVMVHDRIARADKTIYICGNDDFVIAFDFDQEWDEVPVKTARFVYNGKHTDVVFSGNTCNVPRISNTHGIKVGVYAGDLQTTTPAYVSASKSILCGSSVPDAPTDDVYNQIMKEVNAVAKKADAMTALDSVQFVGNDQHNGSFVNLNGIISAPIVGSVEGKVITLSGNLAKGVYEVKYILADGTTADIGTIEVV